MPGEILARLLASVPWKGKPKGVSSRPCANYAWLARDSWKGQSPGAATDGSRP